VQVLLNAVSYAAGFPKQARKPRQTHTQTWLLRSPPTISSSDVRNPSRPPLTVSRASIESGLSGRSFEEADRYKCHGQFQYMFVCYDFTQAKGMDYYNYADNIEFSFRLSLKLA